MQFCGENGILTARLGGEILRIEPWGKDSLRVRATRFSTFSAPQAVCTPPTEGLRIVILLPYSAVKAALIWLKKVGVLGSRP